jgi:hypothetical protein
MLDLWFAEADHEAAHSVAVKVAQQRQGPGKQRELAYGTVEVRFARGVADSLRVGGLEAPADFGVNVP